MDELPLNLCIEIWFKRFFSTCRKCDVLLSVKNSYRRDDTYSQLHTYCKSCYIEIQTNRHNGHVKFKTVYLIDYRTGKPIIFNSEDEKQTFIRERKSLVKFSRGTDTYSSRVGCCEDWDKPNKLLCDQCGSLLRYNPKGELQCTGCNLIFDSIPLALERNISFERSWKHDDKSTNYQMKNSYWEDQLEDNGVFDVYYSKAYSKHTKFISR
jgi:hypothetical protein